jgi:quercetin dioxygenase-like cupin family protein
VIEVHRAADRFETVQPGITTRHCLSSGAHYDEANTGFGPLVAVDEHVLAPGAGFARHAHHGVDIVSWVLDGTLRHEDSSGRVELVQRGTGQVQPAGSGIEHAEGNGSDSVPLRFVQLVLLGDIATAGYLPGRPPWHVGTGEFAVLHPAEPTELTRAGYLHVFLATGTVRLGDQRLRAGDSARLRDTAVSVEGDGELLVWRSGAGS